MKHLAYVEMGYFGATFGRPVDEARVWVEDEDDTPNWDLWARADESRAEIVALYRRAWTRADETLATLSLDAAGRVPWWGDDGEVTLHRVLVHVIAETDRHVGHADIVRELIDGAAGLRAGSDNLPAVEPGWWARYRDELERVAQEAGGR